MLGPTVLTKLHLASYPRFAHDGGRYCFHKKMIFKIAPFNIKKQQFTACTQIKSILTSDHELITSSFLRKMISEALRVFKNGTVSFLLP